MSEILPIAESAMSLDQRKIDMVSHNLANVSTSGYKRQTLALSYGLTENNISSYSPTRGIDHSQGSLKQTGNLLNVTINGDGFFVVDSDGSSMLTRKSSFSVDPQGYLALNTGERLNGTGGLIQLDPGKFEVKEDGSIYQAERFVDKLRVVNVDELGALNPVGNGIYQTNEALEDASSYKIMQGFEESSNVDSLNEMLELMVTMRHYESMSEVIKSYDSILGKTISDLVDY